MPTDAVAFTNAHFGAGVGPIHLDNVDCSVSESNLTECSRSFAVSCYNDHLEDAGVRCQGELGITELLECFSCKMCHTVETTHPSVTLGLLIVRTWSTHKSSG